QSGGLHGVSDAGGGQRSDLSHQSRDEFLRLPVQTRSRSRLVALAASSAFVVTAGCGSPDRSNSPASAPAPATATPAKPPSLAAGAEEPLPPLPYESALQ